MTTPRRMANKYSADVDEAKLKQVENNLHLFTHKMDPVIVLPYLKSCLGIQYANLRRQCDRQSKLKVNQLLWGYLKRAPRWWQSLEAALYKCGYNDLLGILQSEPTNPTQMLYVRFKAYKTLHH